MPSHHPLRRDSWPPTVVRLTSDDEDALADDIDENPFSYFLEPDFDRDMELDLDLDAGIERSPSADPHDDPDAVREVSPSTVQRLPAAYLEVEHTHDQERDHDQEREHEHARLEHALHAWLAAPLSLRDFSRLHHQQKPRSSKVARNSSGSSSTSPVADSRGRGIVRLAPRSRAVPLRPHSWREPSPDIESIAEEEDEDARMEEAPALSEGTPEPEPEREEKVGRRKERGGKRVRWAALPVK